MKRVNDIEIEKYLFIDVIFNLWKQYPFHNFLSTFLNQTKDLTHPNHIIYSCNAKYTVLVDQRIFLLLEPPITTINTLQTRISRMKEQQGNVHTFKN